jgi:hypothetical protein
MTLEERLLSKARKVWREDAAPSDAEVHRGVDRAVRRLRLHKHGMVAPRLWAASGAMAAFIATLAYAGRGSLLQPVWDALAARGALVNDGWTSPARNAGTAPGTPRSDQLEATPSSVSNGVSGTAGQGAANDLAQRAKPVLSTFELGDGSTGSGALAPAPGARSSTAPPTTLLSPTADLAGDEGTRRATKARSADSSRNLGARGHARTSLAARRVSQAQARALAEREPSWSDVNEALAVHDRARANELLARLAERGPDADTRAKALLGIAQLEAGAGDCETGRRLALEVAARPGIEIKTVRRALELASRCAR